MSYASAVKNTNTDKNANTGDFAEETKTVMPTKAQRKFTQMDFRNLMIDLRNTKRNPTFTIKEWLRERSMKIQYIPGRRDIGMIKEQDENDRKTDGVVFSKEFSEIIGMVVDVNPEKMSVLRYTLPYRNSEDYEKTIGEKNHNIPPLGSVITVYALPGRDADPMAFAMASYTAWGLRGNMRYKDPNSRDWSVIWNMINGEDRVDGDYALSSMEFGKNYHFSISDPDANPFAACDELTVTPIGVTDLATGEFSICDPETPCDASGWAIAHSDGFLLNTKMSRRAAAIMKNSGNDRLMGCRIALRAFNDEILRESLNPRWMCMIELARENKNFNQSDISDDNNVHLLFAAMNESIGDVDIEDGGKCGDCEKPCDKQ
ncbi:MAG: hypothetical protein CMK92_04465 [Pseudomonas sp.]|nr:hypothetical protein [Pseudomonas sp.]|tara:strand:+ start:275 stop:1396 length:1122 start_codon:yes stop_codon:yes gene_type:complete